MFAFSAFMPLHETEVLCKFKREQTTITTLPDSPHDE